MINRHLPAGILLCLILIFPGHLHSQSERSIRAMIQDTAFADLIIPVTEVPARSQETISYITSLKTEADSRTDISSTIAEYDTLQKQADNLLDEIGTGGEVKAMTSVVLQKSLYNWNAIRSALLVLSDNLSTTNSWMAERREELNKFTLIWKNTRKNARDKQADKAVLERIEFVRKELSGIDKSLKSKFNEGVKYEVRISESLDIIQNELNKLKEIEEAAYKNLLAPDSQPLIQALKEQKETDEPPREIADFSGLFKQKSDDIIKYYQTNKHFFQIIIFIYVLLISLLFILKRRYSNWMEYVESENAVIAVINRPLAVSTIFILFIANNLLPSPIIILVEVILLISIFPVLSIVFGNTDKSIRKYLIVLACILIITRFYFIFIETVILARLLTFGLAILMSGILIFISRYKVLSQQVKISKFYSNLLIGTGISLSAISILANLIGNTSLSAITLFGLLDSILASLLIYVLYIILTGLNSIIIKSPFAQRSYMIHNFTDTVESKINKYIRLFLVVLWMSAILKSFNLYDNTFNWIESILTASLSLGELELSLGSIFLFIFVLWLSMSISKLVTFILEEEVYRRTETPIGVSATVTSLLKFALITLGFLFAISAAGFSLSNITLLVSAFGVGIGFGLQNIFNNLVSGIIIATERPVQVGDTIEVGALLGEVKSIGIRASVVRTWDGAEVIVPNGNLISAELINWTLSDRQRRLKIPVGVAYGSDPHKVMDLLLQIAKEEDRLLKFPEPYVLFQGFGESSLDFELRCWTSDFSHWIFIQSDLVVKIHDALYEEGIVIPFPQRDLHIKSVDKEILAKTLSSETMKQPRGKK